jgi:flagellar biosynthesis regulator FlbT
MNESSFDQWAIIEVFGHEKYAGHVSSTNVGGHAMILLEVPEVQNMKVTLPAFTKYISLSSVFSITPVGEEYAREMAAKLSKQPISGYEHQQVITQLAKKATEDLTLTEIKKLMDRQALLTGVEEDQD